MKAPAEELIAKVRALGGRLVPRGERLHVEAPAPLPEPLLEELRQHKPALLVALREQATPGEHAEALEDSLRLGRRLALREIKALRCGITGCYCRALPWRPVPRERPLGAGGWAKGIEAMTLEGHSPHSRGS